MVVDNYDKAFEIIDDNYMKWLQSFTLQHDIFTDKEMITNCINKTDESNVFSLSSLYELIDDYASYNKLSLEFDSWGRHYNVKYDKDVFMIGIPLNEESSIFIGRIDNKPGVSLTNIINFTQLREIKFPSKNKFIREKLLELDRDSINILTKTKKKFL